VYSHFLHFIIAKFIYQLTSFTNIGVAPACRQTGGYATKLVNKYGIEKIPKEYSRLAETQQWLIHGLLAVVILHYR
jgi:hypothetical protein